MGPVWQAFPEFLASTNYRDTSDECNTAFRVAHKTALAGMAWVQEQPQAAASFNDYMAFHRKHQPSCWDAYPVTEEVSEWNHHAVLVDIGGSLAINALTSSAIFPIFPDVWFYKTCKDPYRRLCLLQGWRTWCMTCSRPNPSKVLDGSPLFTIQYQLKL